MSWSKLLEKPVVGDTCTEELQAFLRREIPKFKRPTDVKAWPRQAAKLRRQALEQVYLRGYSDEVVNAKAAPVDCGRLEADGAYEIRKLRYQAVPGYWVPALMYVPRAPRASRPAMLVAHGHGAGGKAMTYLQILCSNLARRGIVAMTFEFLGMGELGVDGSHFNQSMLSLTGMSGVGVFYLSMRKALDVLVEQPGVDQTRVGMTGLSGGGWQTITLASMDERITLAAPVAGYTSLRSRIECTEDIGDLEQNPPDLTTILDYQDMTAMLAPRPVLQILNENDDCCFKTERARPVIYDALRPVWKAFGEPERLQFHSNTDPGTHNYEVDNRRRLYRFLDEHWQLGEEDDERHEAGDIFSESAINCGLPADQKTIVDLARDRARELAGRRKTPTTARQREALRGRLRDVLRLADWSSRKTKVAQSGRGTLWSMKVGPFTVPVAGQAPATRGHVGDGACRLIISDDGRGGVKSLPTSWPKAADAFFVADIFGTGENKPSVLHQQLVEAAGHRLLGIQVTQVLALMELAQKQSKRSRIVLEGHGYTSAMVALVAAAMRPASVERLVMTWEMMSLTHLIERQISWFERPSLFCPRLLEVADVAQLLALLEDVVVEYPGRGVPVVAGGRVVESDGNDRG